jgi:hypothetical protein
LRYALDPTREGQHGEKRRRDNGQDHVPGEKPD